MSNTTVYKPVAGNIRQRFRDLKERVYGYPLGHLVRDYLERTPLINPLSKESVLGLEIEALKEADHILFIGVDQEIMEDVVYMHQLREFAKRNWTRGRVYKNSQTPDYTLEPFTTYRGFRIENTPVQNGNIFLRAYTFSKDGYLGWYGSEKLVVFDKTLEDPLYDLEPYDEGMIRFWFGRNISNRATFKRFLYDHGTKKEREHIRLLYREFGTPMHI